MNEVRPNLRPGQSLDGPRPPVVNISREVRRSDKVNEAYSQALDDYGPVVVVPRHGRKEYVIDHRYAHELLTNTKDFEFDKIAFKLLHFGFLALFDKEGRFVHDIDSLVDNGVQPRMNGIIDQIFPVFESYFDQMASEMPHPNEAKTPVEFTDIFSRMQHAVAHAMVVMILGHEHSSPAAAGHFAAVAVAMAKMTGMHENTHEWIWAPWLWVFITGTSAVLFTIIPRFFFGVVPALWKTRQQHLARGLAAKPGMYVPLFDYLLAKQYHGKTGLAAFFSFSWCVVLCVGMIFASIHQTVVAGFGALIQLALKQEEYLPQISQQWDTVAPLHESMTVKKLSQLTLLDSFIREVLRTKGDTWGPVRQTTQPVRIGPYVLPKDAMCIVLISRAHKHPDNYGTTGNVFNGFQWAEKGQAAVQGSAQFLTFGLGRWACPGRQLAIHEIKIMIYLLFTRFEVKVKENTFAVKNTINTTSVPPEATFLIRRKT
nr:25-hydroxyvitamin d-1 alpha hydroxylase, mitochondrial [Quercus suber]